MISVGFNAAARYRMCDLLIEEMYIVWFLFVGQIKLIRFLTMCAV